MLVAIPEVPETPHQQATTTATTTTVTTTTTSSTTTNNSLQHLHHHHHLLFGQGGILLNGTTTVTTATTPGILGGREANGGRGGGGGGGGGRGEGGEMIGEVTIKREMKPPISASIPKSRNHRRTPPTPPALSPSPPALTPPPSMTSQIQVPPSLLADINTDKISSSHVMEINTPYAAPLVKKELSSPPLDSPHPPPSSTEFNNMANDAAVAPDSFQQKILLLKQQQEIQQQLLLHEYQKQQQQLAEQHEKQLQQHIKLQHSLLYHQFQQEHQRLLEQQQNELQSHLKQQYLEQQSQRAEEERVEKQRKEMEKLEHLKKKEKHEQSAIASSEVKQRLAEVIMQKKKREQEASTAAAAAGGATNLRNWPTPQRSVDKSTPPSYTPNAAPSSSHPYRPPGHILSKCDEDFLLPLRKTASEPNIYIKARHKQRVVTERRPSPSVRRKDHSLGPIKRRQTYTVESGSTPDSGQSSPPNGLPASRSSSSSTPIHEEGGGSPYGALGGGGQGSFSDPPLYSSPSLPNISLGRPPHSTQPEGMKLPMVSEGNVRAAVSAHMGVPLTGHVVPNTLQYYPTLSLIDSEGFAGASGIGRQQLVAMDTSPGGGIIRGGIYPPNPVPNMIEAQGRPSRSLQRPLGRTHSSPLPLAHPMLQGTPPTYHPHGLPSPHQYDPKHAMDHHNLKKQLRQTVLIRSGSKNHVENVAEETEAAVAQAIAPDKTPEEEEEEVLHEEEPEVGPCHITGAVPALTGLGNFTHSLSTLQVIDLTERKLEENLLTCERDRMFLHHHRDLQGKPPPLHSVTGSAFTPRSGSHIARPLSRALSSPLVTLSPQGSPQEPININKQGATTGLAYDNIMLKHQCICGDNSHHPEHGGRLQSIWARLQETGLLHRVHRIRPRKATLEEIQSCHSEAHTLLFGTNPLNRQNLDMRKFTDLPIKSFVRLNCGGVGVDSDTTWNEMHTSFAARMAAGCVIDLAFKVATGELRNGFALVRPPGHHAEHQQAMGFCFFNSIAIAARQLQQKLNVEKILIIDWDVHHGNGTQSMFYEDPHILYISMHRYDDGSFFPGTGAPIEVGEGDGYGFNVNIAFSGGLNPPMGDAEYMAAFRTIVMPIAKDFDPDIVLISAGFDAADGHPSPLGGYKVSSSCFAHMTKQLMTLARGKVVLALEGGYNLTSICDCTEMCVRTLSSDETPPIAEHEMTRPPCQGAVETLQNVIAVQSGHWPVVRRNSGMIALSMVEAQGREEEQETVSAMASLQVDPQNHPPTQSPESPAKSPVAPENSNDEEEPMEEDTEVK